jgi:hypothetical protein
MAKSRTKYAPEVMEKLRERVRAQLEAGSVTGNSKNYVHTLLNTLKERRYIRSWRDLEVSSRKRYWAQVTVTFPNNKTETIEYRESPDYDG